MRAWVVFAVAATLVAPMSAARAEGALAVGGGSFGFTRNEPTMNYAEQLALTRCGNSQCKIVETFSHACEAYAQASSGAAGWARGSERIARRHAVENCADAGGEDCTVRTNRGYECDGL